MGAWESSRGSNHSKINSIFSRTHVLFSLYSAAAVYKAAGNYST